MLTQFMRPFRLSWIHIVAAILFVLYVDANIFWVGGYDFVFNLNNIVVYPVALGTAVLSILLCRQTKPRSHFRSLWGGLALGWLLWTIAEFWWGIASSGKSELPYPSWPDFFWLIGYVPMVIALQTRIRSVKSSVAAVQKVAILAVTMVTILWSILFVLLPILRNNNPDDLVESILNIVYPIVDLVLLVMVMRIFFTYQKGIYGTAWIWLAVGFLFHSASNLLFSYATTENLYYPNNQLNLLSTLEIDVPYALSYGFWIIGLVMLLKMYRTYKNIANSDVKVLQVPNTHILIATTSDDLAIHVSENYARIYPTGSLTRRNLSDVLGITEKEATDIILEVKAQNILCERMFKSTTSTGENQIFISGATMLDKDGKYSGALLLVRLYSIDHSLDGLLSEYEKGVIQSLMNRTGTGQKEEMEIKQLLENYHSEYLRTFYNRAYAEGGSVLADGLVSEIQAICRVNEWPISIQPDDLLDVSASPLSTLVQALPGIRAAARDFMIQITDVHTVDSLLEEVDVRFGEEAIQNINHFGMPRRDAGRKKE